MLVPLFDWTHFSLTADALACAALVLLYRLARTGWRKDLPLPPGPTTSWFGRINLPKTSEHPWKSYKKWKDIYGATPFQSNINCLELTAAITAGDVIYIYVLGNPIIILNSREATRDLLDKRSAYYSSRPVRTMVIDLYVHHVYISISAFHSVSHSPEWDGTGFSLPCLMGNAGDNIAVYFTGTFTQRQSRRTMKPR